MKYFFINIALILLGTPFFAFSNCDLSNVTLRTCENDPAYMGLSPSCLYECEITVENRDSDFVSSTTKTQELNAQGRCDEGKAVKTYLFQAAQDHCKGLKERRDQREKEKQEEEDQELEEEKRLEDQLSEEIKEKRRAQEEQMRRQEELKLQMAGQCREENRDLISQRDRIESRVRSIESEVDELRDVVTKNQSMQSEEEQRLKEEIQKLTQDQRDLLLRYEKEIQDAEDQSDQFIRSLEKRLLVEVHKLENTTDQRNLACNNRFNEYLLVKEACFNQAFQEVRTKRADYYKQLYSNRQAQSVSEVFSENLQTIENNFTDLLYSKEEECYSRAIGKTEQVVCSIDSLRDRDEVCKREDNKGEKCPTAQARVIENKLLENLSGIKNQEDLIKMEIEAIYESLDEAPTKKAQAVGRLKKDLENQQKRFTERYDSLSERLERARLRRIVDTQRAQQKIQRLLQEDPARHFGEQIKRVVNICCSSQAPLTTQDCSSLNTYLQDATRNQFLFAQPTPTHRQIIRRSSTPQINSGGVR